MIGLSFRSKPVQYSDFILFRQFGEPSHTPLKIFPSTWLDVQNMSALTYSFFDFMDQLDMTGCTERVSTYLFFLPPHGPT